MDAQHSSKPPAWLIVGGKTRLAMSLFEAASASGHETFVVYASTDEHAALQALYPASALLEASQRMEGRSLCIFVCAFGLAHPGKPDPQRHSERLLQDAALLFALVRTHAGGVHVLLVSTVVALAPPRDRCYYAGFKNLAESVVAAQLQGVEGAMLSVFYPGRLVERRSGSGPTGLLATPYRALARQMVDAARGSSDVNRIVGIDARLWLMVNAIRMILQSIIPSFGKMNLHSRDGLPRSRRLKNS